MQDKELINKLMEEHADDFESVEKNLNDEGNDAGGDNSQDKSDDASTGTEDSSKDNDVQPPSDETEKKEAESGADEAGPAKPDDSQNPEIEPVGEKKDANSRIRQLIEKNKEMERKLAEKEEAERKEREAKEDPIYTIDDFVGTVDENGDPLSEGEAKARFKAWESDYKLRQFQKEQVLKEQQQTLISLQRETADAFTKFPEFDINSDSYDEKLAGLANKMFEAGLQYDNAGRIIGSKVNPGQLLAELHELRSATPKVTRVNNLPSEDSKIVSSQQVNKSAPKYQPGFRGEVDKEIDNLIKKGF
jgi:hypothetical protein